MTLKPSKKYPTTLMALAATAHEDTRATRLAHFVGGRYNHREHAYLMSFKAAKEWETLFNDGYDVANHELVKHSTSVETGEIK